MAKRFSSKKPLTPSELKQFRASVSSLKKQGLIPKSVDARTARPYFVRGGKTLAEIVNKYNEPKPSAKPSDSPRLAPLKRPISLRDLPGNKRKSLASLFRDIENDPSLEAKINALKKPDEFFTFEIEGTRSIYPYRDIGLLLERFKYEGKQAAFDIYHKRQKSIDLFSKLKIVRWNDTATEWRAGAVKRTARKQAAAKRQAQHRRKKK